MRITRCWQRNQKWANVTGKNGADRLARHRVATVLYFVRNAIFAKHWETRSACKTSDHRAYLQASSEVWMGRGAWHWGEWLEQGKQARVQEASLRRDPRILPVVWTHAKGLLASLVWSETRRWRGVLGSLPLAFPSLTAPSNVTLKEYSHLCSPPKQR